MLMVASSQTASIRSLEWRNTMVSTSGTSEQPESLNNHLLQALKRQTRGKRDFEIRIIQSSPKRSYSLFPWATDQNVKVYQEHTLVILAERVPDAESGPLDESAEDGSSKAVESAESSAQKSAYVPVFGLETAIYTIPQTSTALLYVSKVDTTGLLTQSAPSKILTRAFLDYHLQNHPHSVQSLRIHVFARSQDQYLFPGSIENKAKRVLDDKGLCKWWRSTLGDAASTSLQSSKASTLDKAVTNDLKLYYLLAGYDHLESLALLSAAAPVPDGQPQWQYGHPYSVVRPPLAETTDHANLTINDLIPAFQDDPKSRYMTSLTSSPLPPAGDKGDYDDVMESLKSGRLAEGNTAVLTLRSSEVEKQRMAERSRLLTRGIDEFWECMGGRQECCAGHVAGFFVVISEIGRAQLSTEVAHEAQEASRATPEVQQSITPPPQALSYASYVRLWSAIHNVNYASLSAGASGYQKWTTQVEMASRRENIPESIVDREMRGKASVDNQVDIDLEDSKKRKEPPKPVVNLLVRKKKVVKTT